MKKKERMTGPWKKNDCKRGKEKRNKIKKRLKIKEKDFVFATIWEKRVGSKGWERGNGLRVACKKGWKKEKREDTTRFDTKCHTFRGEAQKS